MSSMTLWRRSKVTKTKIKTKTKTKTKTKVEMGLDSEQGLQSKLEVELP